MAVWLPAWRGPLARPIEIDRLLDRILLAEPRPGETTPERRRIVRDAAHFLVSLASEARSAARAAPGYLGELLRNGFYPDRIGFRKLRYLPERSDLRLLREWNPHWVFREDFDPRHWVIVWLHGAIDNSGAGRVAYALASLGYQVYLVWYPFLRNVRRLAAELHEVLERIASHERGKRFVPIGHSLGGFVWDHLLLHRPEVVERYRMPLYIPMGSPHFGTLPAFLGFGRSLRQMQPASDLVREHRSLDFPPALEIYPFVSRFDLFVLPIETALLKRGINYLFSETGHLAQVIRGETVTAIEEVMASPRELLESRAARRPFYLSTFTRLLSLLPRSSRERLGIEAILDYVRDGELRLRVVHHELRLGLLPGLRRPPRAW